MSRSRKKPWITDVCHENKKIHSRKFRRTIRCIVNYFNWRDYWEDDIAMLPLPREITNDYDVCDHRFYWPEDARSHRK